MLKFLLLCSLLSVHTLACTESGKGFLPENNLKFPISKDTGLSVEEYHATIDKFARVYSPIARKHGARLIIERKWESETVNAGTLRTNGGKNWVINLYGGYARHPDITSDGYMLVLCHEIGHHIGGAPKKRYESSGIHWASTEGQSDYFATLKCLRKIFRKEDNEAAIKDIEVPESVRTSCQHSFPTSWEVALCIRTSLAGVSVSKVSADVRRVEMPDIEVLDSRVATSTDNNHPLPQCRLNTYYQGSICPVPSTRPVSQRNVVTGTCHSSLGHSVGLRPHCWFKAK